MLQTVPLSQAKSYAFSVLKSGLVPFLTSSPGVGKSAIAREIAAEAGLKLIDIRLANEDPTVLNGYPQIVDGRSITAAPLRFPIEGDEVPEGYDGWLILFDELPSAPRSVIAAAYKIVLDRMVGERKLHSKVCIMAAGNTLTDNAIVNEMGTAMRSRLVHIAVATDPKEWVCHAYSAGFDIRIPSYINFRPDQLNTFTKFSSSSDETFTCERTWEFASKILKANCPDESAPIPQELTTLLTGVIGSAAYEFVQFTYAFNDLPKMSEILNNPTMCMTPTQSAVTWLLVGMLISNTTKDNLVVLLSYINRLPVEFQFAYVSGLYRGKYGSSYWNIPEFKAVFTKVSSLVL